MFEQIVTYRGVQEAALISASLFGSVLLVYNFDAVASRTTRLFTATQAFLYVLCIRLVVGFLTSASLVVFVFALFITGVCFVASLPIRLLLVTSSMLSGVAGHMVGLVGAVGKRHD